MHEAKQGGGEQPKKAPSDKLIGIPSGGAGESGGAIVDKTLQGLQSNDPKALMKMIQSRHKATMSGTGGGGSKPGASKALASVVGAALAQRGPGARPIGGVAMLPK